MNATALRSGFAVAYDLRDPGGWGKARRHGRLWGRLYTDIHYLDELRIVLVFRPAPGERWREWEQVRRNWIERELGNLA